MTSVTKFASVDGFDPAYPGMVRVSVHPAGGFPFQLFEPGPDEAGDPFVSVDLCAEVSVLCSDPVQLRVLAERLELAADTASAAQDRHLAGQGALL